MTKWIYSFEEGSAKDKALLGGKGADSAEMSHLGLPVPPGIYHYHRKLHQVISIILISLIPL